MAGLGEVPFGSALPAAVELARAGLGQAGWLVGLGRVAVCRSAKLGRGFKIGEFFLPLWFRRFVGGP